MKDLVSLDEKDKLYFIAKDGNKQEVFEEVKEQSIYIDSSVLIMGAEDVKVLEEVLDGKKFRLELKYRGTRDGFCRSDV